MTEKFRVRKFSEIGENEFPFRIKKWKKTNIVFTIFFAIACFATISDNTLRVDLFSYLALIVFLFSYVTVINIIDWLSYSAAKDYKETKKQVDYKSNMKRANFNKADQEKIKKDADDLDLDL